MKNFVKIGLLTLVVVALCVFYGFGEKIQNSVKGSIFDAEYPEDQEYFKNPQNFSNALFRRALKRDGYSFYSTWIEQDHILYNVDGDEEIWGSAIVKLPSKSFELRKNLLKAVAKDKTLLDMKYFSYDKGEMLVPALKISEKNSTVFVQLGKQTCFENDPYGVSEKFFHEKIHKLKSYQDWIDAVLKIGMPEDLIFQMTFNRGYKFFKLTDWKLEEFSSKSVQSFLEAHRNQVEDVFENVDLQTTNQYIELGAKISQEEWANCKKMLLPSK